MTDLPKPILAAIDAANSGDVDAFLATFAPVTGLFDDWGHEYRGADEIRRWSDGEFIGRNVTIDVVFSYTNDDEAVVLAQVGGDSFNGAYTYSFCLEDDSLTTMRVIG